MSPRSVVCWSDDELRGSIERSKVGVKVVLVLACLTELGRPEFDWVGDDREEIEATAENSAHGQPEEEDQNWVSGAKQADP